jgi:predicted  nucleic acid-binding Zn-ribbon protein
MGIFNIRKKDPLDDDILKYERLSSFSPEDAGLRNTLGDLFFKKGDLVSASLNYHDAIGLFLKQNQKDKAIALTKKVISHDLIDSESVRSLLEDFLKKGFKRESIALYSLLAKQKQYADRTFARILYDRILQLDPNNRDALAFMQIEKKSLDKISDRGVKDSSSPAPSEVVSPAPDGELSKMRTSVGQDAEGIKEKGMKDEVVDKRKIDVKVPEKDSLPLKPEKNGTPLKDKFIGIAKEKSHLETIIVQQNDVIKKLEKEKKSLIQRLNQFTEDYKSQKKKMLDLDVLRSREVSELKKQIEIILPENKMLKSEKERILKTLERDQENISARDRQAIEALKNEKMDLEALLRRMDDEKDELNKDVDELTSSVEEKVRENEELGERLLAQEGQMSQRENELNERIASFERELAQQEETLKERAAFGMSRDEELQAAMESVQAAEQESESLREQVESLTGELSSLREAQAGAEEATQKAAAYEREIEGLKEDVDELTSSVEEKVRENEEMEERLLAQEGQLSQRENELNERIANLTGELVHKDELLRERVEAYQTEKDELLNRLREDENSLTSMRDEIRGLRTEVEELKDRDSDSSRLYEDSEREKRDAEEQLSQALKKILEVETQYSEKLSVLSSAQQDLSDLQRKYDSEISSLSSEVEQLKSEAGEKTRINAAREEMINNLSAEKTDLLEKLSVSDKKLEDLKDEKGQEITKMKEQLGAAFVKIGELESSLKISLKSNVDLRNKLDEKLEGFAFETQKESVQFETVSDRELTPRPEVRDLIVFKEKKSWLSYANYVILLMLLVISSLIMYRIFNLKPTVPEQKIAAVPMAYTLQYSEIFDMLNRSGSTGNIKLQSTLMSELLARKENAGRILAQFDFSRYYYFKVNINSSKDALSRDLTEKPLSSLKIIDDRQNIVSPEKIALEEVKTFYRNHKPVSLAFLCIVSKESIGSDMKSLDLLFSHGNDTIRLTWDVQKLRDENIIL